MIQLKGDSLVFTFPEVHPQARLSIDFQRTLRIPDDGDDYPLPPGLGRFPIRHVDDFGDSVPGEWLEHGGVMLPMYQSEAMWLNFDTAFVSRQGNYPFAIKIAAGKIDAVSGERWSERLHGKPQDYMVAPEQPWLDGFCVEKGVIRQFVAMPLGAGYSAEEQLTDEAEYGGIQILAYPMKRDVFDRRFPVSRERARMNVFGSVENDYCLSPEASPSMALAPGGRMRQEIYDDPFELEDWDTEAGGRCFTHIANSMVWQSITGVAPPTVPPTSNTYNEAGLPWFEYYSEGEAIEGSKRLRGLKSVVEKGKEKGDVPLPENESVSPGKVVHLSPERAKDQVREGRF